ncbi:MAG: ABC transporter ATP-binding protein [Burkholderiales bacterium]|nr:ABC transporter ATP-binding protein [Burkholderiales bacterium]
MSDFLLDVQQLSKRFGDRLVVDHISFSVREGQTLGLLGPNGAGKSSTVNMICGLLRADSGQVLLSGQLMGAGANPVKKKLGLVPQDLALYEELSALNNLKLFGALYGLSGKLLQQRCDTVLDLVSLRDRAKDRVQDFSGGMKRRLNIAAAMLHEPALLILDEPTVGVDPQSRNAIFEALEALRNEGHALIYTSHYMEEVERLADHIVMIDHGKLIANESPAALYARLPAQAALELVFDRALSDVQQQALHAISGVIQVEVSESGCQVKLALKQQNEALFVLNALTQIAPLPLHFSTAKTKLEEVFLTLTGRSLRD